VKDALDQVVSQVTEEVERFAIFFWDHKSPQKAFVFLDVRLPST
jgi:hypothetical protein